jgi:hypothetical protein
MAVLLFLRSLALRGLYRAVIRGRSEAGRLVKGGGERAGPAKPDRQSNLGNREFGLGQKYLGLLHAPAAVISARRQAEGLLERPTEIVRAQTYQLGKPGERYLLGKVLIDIGGDDALLPSRETPSHRSFLAPNPGIQPRHLVRQDDAESLKIGSAGRGRTLDQPRQLERRLPQKNNRAAKTVPAALISGVRILAGSK